MDNTSIDDIFGTQDFIRDLKYHKDSVDNNYRLNKRSEENLYLTITNTKNNQSAVYILKPVDTDAQLKVDNYRKCA